MHLNTVEKLKNGNQLFVFYSNDKGRGKSNCTIQLVEKSEKRKLTAKLTKHILAETYTTAWRGDINFSKRIQKLLGIDETDLVRINTIKRNDARIKNASTEKQQLNFDLLWMKIDKDNDMNFGIVTKNQLKQFAEKVYIQAWHDRYQIDWE